MTYDKKPTPDAIRMQLERIIQSTEFRTTDKQKKFVLEITKGKSRTQAAMSSFDCSSMASAKAIGNELMQKPDIQTSVAEIMQQQGLTRRYRIDKLKTHIDNKDPNVSLKGLDQSWRLDGAYAPEKHVHAHFDYNEALKEYEAIRAERIALEKKLKPNSKTTQLRLQLKIAPLLLVLAAESLL